MTLYDFVQKRSLGLASVSKEVQKCAIFRNYSSLTMREVPVTVPNSNKIFASKWISHSEIVFGTKCNQLNVLNVHNQSKFSIPLLKRRRLKEGYLEQQSRNNQYNSNCGIHTITVNPSETRIATGGENPNDVAFYSLPQIDPLALGESGHSDWIFCGSWMDDEFLVTGSRDNYLCMWHIPSDLEACSSGSGGCDDADLPFYCSVDPVAKKLCQTSDRVRAMAFNAKRSELAVTSLNGYIHTWDPGHLRQISSEKLLGCQETVTLCYSEQHNLYCCGSYQYLMFFDPRTMRLAHYHSLKDSQIGIRSLATVDDVLTVGTGKGLIRFYDLSASKFISCNCGIDWYLRAGNGRITENASSISDILNIPPSEYKHAIYTLAYDNTHTRLFAAGGPLHAQISGNYAALWM